MELACKKFLYKKVREGKEIVQTKTETRTMSFIELSSEELESFPLLSITYIFD
jgi:hypothetical protein